MLGALCVHENLFNVTKGHKNVPQWNEIMRLSNWKCKREKTENTFGLKGYIIFLRISI